jgi:hypothetical protein
MGTSVEVQLTIESMNWLLIFLAGLLAVVAFLVWGFVRITRRAKDAAALLTKVEQRDIPALVNECIQVCRERLGTTLSVEDLENSVEALDYVLEPSQRKRMKTAFEIPGHPGRFVLPLGAFLGELVRKHSPGAQWIRRDGGGLAMEIPQGGATLTMHPFDKVLKHGATGAAGEILAYVNVAIGRQPMEGQGRVSH